ncbi:MAG: 4Fe-4S binding protein [Promethearchaeota archaeon]
MRVIGIDNDKCIKCVKCVEICPLALFYKPPTKVGEKRQVIFEDPNGYCSECELCIEICPTDAILVIDNPN